MIRDLNFFNVFINGVSIQKEYCYLLLYSVCEHIEVKKKSLKSGGLFPVLFNGQYSVNILYLACAIFVGKYFFYKLAWV